jgi:deoxyadenosine/deoxycytidine kinase
LEEKFKPKPDGIIYIRCSPEKCLERLNSRWREEETSIKLEYLNRLHNLHEEWFEKWKKTPLLIIDNEKDNNWDEILDKIKEFVHFQVDNIGYSYFT